MSIFRPDHLIDDIYALPLAELKEKGMRDQLVIMVGGGPISASYAEKIGADGYEPDAASAARRARELVMARRGHDVA